MLAKINHWTPKQLVLACALTGLLSALIGAGLVLWLVQPPKTAAMPVFQTQAASPVGDPILGGNAAYDRRQWAEAAKAYEAALASGKDNPDVRTDLGNCYRFLNQPEKALAEYQLAQKLNPNHEHSLYNQVTLYAEVWHNHERAAELAKQYEQRFPQSENLAAVRKFLP